MEEELRLAEPGIRNPKSEGRNPKEIRNPKSEIRSSDTVPHSARLLRGTEAPAASVLSAEATPERFAISAFGFRISDFLRISGPRISGPRISDFARARAFSLIEMLVVIAVIAILASMIFPVTGAVARNRVKSRTRAELEQVVTAIEIYKSKRGQYPPDNHFQNNGLLNPYFNQLYYELVGTTNWVANNDVYYRTSDGRSLVDTGAINSGLHPGYVGGVSGFVNCSTGGSVEEGSTMVNCLMSTLRADQVAQTPGGFKVLVCSVPLPSSLPLGQWPNLPHYPTPYPGSAQINTNSPSASWYCAWRYNSSSPTNNPGTYDLWVDVIINGKTNRFSNWSRDPVLVNSP